MTKNWNLIFCQIRSKNMYNAAMMLDSRRSLKGLPTVAEKSAAAADNRFLQHPS
jgi:hypothetical protein